MTTPESPAVTGAAMREQTSIDGDGDHHHADESRRAFFTVGHATLGLEEVIAMLRKAGVVVRRLPGSGRYPWFDAEPLEVALREAGLTGRRPKSKDGDPSLNAFWQNQSFHNYADHTQGGEFAATLADLQAAGDARPAILCAEAVWWRCRRRLIAAALLARDETASFISWGRERAN